MVETTAETSETEAARDAARTAAWCRAVRIADDFLRRWDDHLTTSQRDDLGMEAAVMAVDGWSTLRDEACFPSFVRTIARRQRAQAVRERMRQHAAGLEIRIEVRDEFPQPDPETRAYPVAGRWMQRTELVDALPCVLAELRPINARLLMSYYEGFSCAELAERHGLSLEGVRVRIHRSRQRVRQLFERMAIRDSGGQCAKRHAGPSPRQRTTPTRQRQRR